MGSLARGRGQPVEQALDCVAIVTVHHVTAPEILLSKTWGQVWPPAMPVAGKIERLP
jgi:hypothetical protein